MNLIRHSRAATRSTRLWAVLFAPVLLVGVAAWAPEDASARESTTPQASPAVPVAAVPSEGDPSAPDPSDAVEGGRPSFGDGTPHTISYDKYSMKIDGDRQYIWSGEFHPFRVPNPDLWRDMLQKYKANGFNTVSFYFSWAQYSAKDGVYDFEGIRDVEKLLDIAEEVGLYVIARPGPYINAEVDSGGFPGWLQTQAGRARTDADDYQAAWEDYFDQINPIIARHQLVDGGGSVILYQIENEYTGTNASGQTYMEEMKAAVREDGITVPLFHNDKGRELRWACGKGAPDLYATDTYPGTSVTDYEFLRDGTSFEPDRCGVGDRPFFWAEFQGGWFQPWGGGLYEDNRDKYGPDFERITYGNNINNHFTMQNLYMAYGGTNIGWTADPAVVYTSYDYHAAFSEARELTNKIPVVKQQGYLVDAVKDLRQLDNLPGQVEHSNPAVHVDGDVNPATGAKAFFVRHEDIKSSTDEGTTLRVEVADGTYTVPQEPGTSLAVHGKDYKILVAGYNMGDQRLVYSTSEIYTHQRIAGRDVAILHNRQGETGETVLRFASEPTVRVLSGSASSTWDAATGNLRLNYVADGLTRVRVEGGGKVPLDLLLADSATASTFWKFDTRSGPVILRGGSMIRSVEQDGGVLKVVGDTDQAGELELFAGAGATNVFWNGALDKAPRSTTVSGSTVIQVAGPRPVTLPALTTWKHTVDQPESALDFDDSGWTAADHLTTNNPTKPKTLPVLYTDDYGFHYGDVWYRGHFTATGEEQGISLKAGTGKAGAWGVWLNGTYLGTVRTSSAVQESLKDIQFPAGLVKPGADNVLSVVVRNMGHNEDGGINDAHKNPRGLLSAKMIGSGSVPTWRIQGARGGEDTFDVTRGVLNNGGLNGERAGFALPGYPTQDWETVTTPQATTTPGLQWYTQDVKLSLPKGQDVPIGLRFGGNFTAKYRALVFVNGWNVGQYINDVGPQRTFYLPEGILKPQGNNRISLAVWSDDGAGLGPVSLTTFGNHLTGLHIGGVESPGYDAARYAETRTVALSVSAPSEVEDGAAFTATARLQAPTGAPGVTEAAFDLTAPDGWTVERSASTAMAASWAVTAPTSGRTSSSPPAQLIASATFTQESEARNLSTSWFVGRPLPPPPPPVPGEHYVSDLPFLSDSNGWGPTERDSSNGGQASGDGAVITVAGIEYAKGLGSHAPARVVLELAGCTRFTAVVGLDAEDSAGLLAFQLEGDGRMLWRSADLTRAATAIADVDVSGVKQLALVIDPLGSNGHDHADWADAKVAGCST